MLPYRDHSRQPPDATSTRRWLWHSVRPSTVHTQERAHSSPKVGLTGGFGSQSCATVAWSTLHCARELTTFRVGRIQQRRHPALLLAASPNSPGERLDASVLVHYPSLLVPRRLCVRRGRILVSSFDGMCRPLADALCFMAQVDSCQGCVDIGVLSCGIADRHWWGWLCMPPRPATRRLTRRLGPASQPSTRVDRSSILERPWWLRGRRRWYCKDLCGHRDTVRWVRERGRARRRVCRPRSLGRQTHSLGVSPDRLLRALLTFPQDGF